MKGILLLSALLLAGPSFARRGDAVEAGFEKADRLIEAGEAASARGALDAILSELKTNDRRLVRYHERTGAAWLREHKTPQARASFLMALKTAQRLKIADDSAAKAYVGMGLCLRREKKDAYATRFYRKALALDLDEGTKLFAEDQIREIEGKPPEPLR